jgi:hypothetical protein
LKLFGEYEILTSDDFYWNDEDCENFNGDVEYITNMPIEVYKKEFNCSIGKKT